VAYQNCGPCCQGIAWFLGVSLTVSGIWACKHTENHGGILLRTLVQVRPPPPPPPYAAAPLPTPSRHSACRQPSGSLNNALRSVRCSSPLGAPSGVDRRPRRRVDGARTYCCPPAAAAAAAHTGADHFSPGRLEALSCRTIRTIQMRISSLPALDSAPPLGRCIEAPCPRRHAGE